ncbi:MAG: DUF2461 domain-containing protein [Flavobacteriaceae bacterium]|nr:DUF2461 domain-containing protein [Flavobacteriaceae bacterium]
MKYFTEDYLEFFKELAANNNKEWFDANRKRYENNVKKPFQKFVDDLILDLSKIDTEIQITSKEAIFRINRDIRFSNDKTPYKLNNSAVISKEGRTDKTHPGLYIELGPEHLRIYGGLYMPSTLEIYKVREAIVNQSAYFKDIVENPIFKKTYGEIRGEKQVRIPKEFKIVAENQPHLLNKQWYYFAQFPSKKILNDDLLELIVNTYQNGMEVKEFFRKALGK